MPKHARPRPRCRTVVRNALVSRSSKTLLIAAVSGGVLVSSGVGSADAEPTAPAEGAPAAAVFVRQVGSHLAASDNRSTPHELRDQKIAVAVAARQAGLDRAAAAKAAAAKAAADTKAAAAQAAAVKAAAAKKAAEAARAARASRTTTRAALPSSIGAKVLAIAARYAGTPYVWGGESPSGFDCSGYVGYVYRQVGILLPRTAAQIYAATERITRSQLRPGDLVFVHKAGTVSHVAIYAGANMWWEANRPGKPVGKHAAWTTSVSYGRVS